jgi:hypothetical protein
VVASENRATPCPVQVVRPYGSREFSERRQGVCHLMPALPRTVDAISPRLAVLAGPVVEQVAQGLATGQGTTAQTLMVPTLLTQGNRSAGRDKVRTTSKRQRMPEKLEAPASCRGCGVILENAGRQYCDDCRPEVHAAQVVDFSAAGRTRLTEFRAAGKDPSRGGEAAKKRAVALNGRMLEKATWEAKHGEAEVDESVLRTAHSSGAGSRCRTHVIGRHSRT